MVKSFSCGLPLWSILVCKIPQFCAKATDSKSPSYFSKKVDNLRLLNSILCFVTQGEPKNVSAYGLIPVYRGVYIKYFKINPPTFCCPLFSEKDQQNNKQTYCQLPIIIFLWTLEGFISPASFLNFQLNLYIPPWLPKSFTFIVLRLLQIHL